MVRPTCAASAPGKVLLTGGFLVLDRKHTGLVFGLDARMHVRVQAVPTSEGVVLQEIIVESPQFRCPAWRYGYSTIAQHGGIRATQLSSLSNANIQPNPFVETALSYALTYISTLIQPVIIEPAFITILADDDYYSQSGASDGHSLIAGEIRFKDFRIPLEQAHKTGLGSSAALVTAFTAAVLQHYLPRSDFSLTEDKGRRILHNLAQAAHSAAQGKIGSGFDVASAVFGSCVYRRFSPSFLEAAGDLGAPGFAQKLKNVVEEKTPVGSWDTETIKSRVSIPDGLRLVMCDVDCGSKTPGMVKQVLEWRKNNKEEADELWSTIQSKSDELAVEMVALSKSPQRDYSRLAGLIRDIRYEVRTMSKLSQVPIEPQAQTELLDACSELEGVIGGVTPGAGGYDAVALLIVDKPEVTKSLRGLCAGWTFKVDDPGVESTGKVRLMGVSGEMEGVKEEDPKMYGAWGPLSEPLSSAS